MNYKKVTKDGVFIDKTPMVKREEAHISVRKMSK